MSSTTEFPACKKIKLINDAVTVENVLPTCKDKITLLTCDSLKTDLEKNFSNEYDQKKIDILLDRPKSDTDLINNKDDLFVFPPDAEITDMLEGIELGSTFPAVTDRYLTAYYKVNVQKPKDDMCIMIHTNRICMICLAPSHTVLTGGKQITKVDFKVSEKVDRTLNKVSGKGKHGAQPLQTNSNICTITCSDGQTHTIKCCMVGKLVEVNEMLLENPELLRKPPHKGGYLAIVLPNIQLLDKMKEALLSQTQYKSLIMDDLNKDRIHSEYSVKENMSDDCIATGLNNTIMDNSDSDSKSNEQVQSIQISGHVTKS